MAKTTKSVSERPVNRAIKLSKISIIDIEIGVVNKNAIIPIE